MNQWHERFQAKEYIYGTTPNEFIKTIHPQLKLSGQALAIAEGEGRNAVYLAGQEMTVTTWDFAQSGLEKTKQLAKERKVSVATEHIDLAGAKWPESKWDEIICVFGHFPKKVQQKTLQGIKKSLKTGGYFLMEVYSVEQLQYGTGGPKSEDLLYQPEDILTAFADFRIIHFFMGEVIRHEGSLHNGLSHVIQLVVQKPVTD